MSMSEGQMLAVTHRGLDGWATSTPYRDIVDDRYSELRRPRVATFYCNGDEKYPGLTMSITPHRYYNINQLMSDLQQRITSLTRLPNGVRRLYRVCDGERISSIDEIDDGEGYACAGREPFRPVEYLCHKVRGPPLPADREHGHGYDSSDRDIYEDGGRTIVRPKGGLGGGQLGGAGGGQLGGVGGGQLGGLSGSRYSTVSLKPIQTRRSDPILTPQERAIHVELERMRASLVERERSRENQEHRNQLVPWRPNGLDNPWRKIDIEREKARIERLRQKYINERKWREKYLYSRRAEDERLEVEALRRFSARQRGPLIIQNIIDREPVQFVPIEYHKERDKPQGRLTWLDDENMFYERYRLIRQVGRGRFSVVHEAVQVSTGQECAVKIIDKRQLSGNDHLIYDEIDILRGCEHPNIVRFIDAFETTGQIFLVTELVNGGDLFDQIVKCVKFEESRVPKMVTDIAQALGYLHSRNIVHRDLKPENILVHKDMGDRITLKLGDMEYATRVNGKIREVCGTPTYVAPEVLEERGYGIEVDCWALGVLTFVLLSGFPPFRSPERQLNELFEFIKAGEYEYLSPYWDNISKDAKDLVDKLLVVDPKRRYSIKDILAHPWVGGRMDTAITGRPTNSFYSSPHHSYGGHRH